MRIKNTSKLREISNSNSNQQEILTSDSLFVRISCLKYIGIILTFEAVALNYCLFV